MMNLSVFLVFLSVAASALARPEHEVQPTFTSGDTNSTLLSSGVVTSPDGSLVGWAIDILRATVESFEVLNVQGIKITYVASGVDGWDLRLRFENIPEVPTYFEYRFYGRYKLATSGDKMLPENVKPHIELIHAE